MLLSVILLTFLSVVVCSSAPAGDENEDFMFPRLYRGLQPLTLDLNDSNKFTLDTHYLIELPGLNKSEDLNVLFTDLDLKLIKNKTFFTWRLDNQSLRNLDGNFTEFNMLHISRYYYTPREMWGKTQEYCIFLWANKTTKVDTLRVVQQLS